MKNYFIIGLLICALQSFGQQKNQLPPLPERINEYLISFPQEKLHLHFDKQTYDVSDTIWFQAYAVDAVDNKPSDRSVFLYVDLINSRDSICESFQFPLNYGFASGDIPLKNQFSKGIYRLRSYTSLMKNNGANFLFNKLISINEEIPERNFLLSQYSVKPIEPHIPVSNTGYDLQFDNTLTDSLYLTIHTSPDLLNKEELILIPSSNGKPLFVFKSRMTTQEIHLTIPKNKLPDGIINFALLNSKDELLVQKMVFNPIKARGILSLSNLAAVYRKKEAVTLNLSASDWLGKPLLCSFSVAVTNTDVVPFNLASEHTIYSSLFLDADFENGIENSNGYLDKPALLDNLLSSRNREKPLWQKISSVSSSNLNHFAELSGKIIDSKHIGLAGAEVLLIPAETGSGNIMNTKSDESGHFHFRIPDSLLSGRFVIKAKSKKLKEPEILLFRDVPLAVKPFRRFLPDSIAGGENRKSETLRYNKAQLIKRNGIDLKEVEIKDYNPRTRLKNSHSMNLNGPGKADKIFTEEDLKHQINWSILSTIPGFTTVRSPISPVGTLHSNRGAPGVAVLVLIDGVPGSLDMVSVHDVESVEVLKDIAYTGIYGIRGVGGVIVITTKKGDGNYISPPSKSIATFQFPISNADVFTPEKDLNSAFTVYWKPDLITDKMGGAAFSFKNSNLPGNYRMVIEGISTTGIPFRKEYFYKVE